MILAEMTHAGPQGPMRQPDGTIRWRLWAPLLDSLSLVTFADGERAETPASPEDFGYFSVERSGVEEGTRYAWRLPDGRELPDPASRWQPDGVNRPSAVWFPDGYTWNDSPWPGIARQDLVLYELHVGTFTPQGTFEAILPRLRQLRDLGVTALELMPLAQFPGDRNWGYDGAHPFAVQNTYGGPQGLQQLVDAAHQTGLAVLIDVVYNHFGPEGNYLGVFGNYYTPRYHTPWGNAVNFDGPNSDPVRQFVVDNARMWIRDFHADGLRLDAVQTIYDLSAQHILADIAEAVHFEGSLQCRTVHVIAESDLNDTRLMKSREFGGYGLDAAWSDDFHHSVHALLTGERDGYYRGFGDPEHLVKAFNDVYVYDGRYCPVRNRRHGAPTKDMDRTRFVVATQNHDQTGNRALGERLTTLLPPPAVRLATGLMMLTPHIPLLWMGEEYGETSPFPFFCSFLDPELIEAVRRGRREEFAALLFDWGEDIPDPQSPETFWSAKPSWDWSTPAAAARRRLFQDFLAARRQWPALRDREHTAAHLVESFAAATGPLLAVERGPAAQLIALANLSDEPAAFPQLDLSERSLVMSTEETCYGGPRTHEDRFDGFYPYEMQIFAPQEWRP